MSYALEKDRLAETETRTKTSVLHPAGKLSTGIRQGCCSANGIMDPFCLREVN